MTAAGLLVPGLADAQANGPHLQADGGVAGLFSEIRGGPIWHDPGAKENSFAINGEVLFASVMPTQALAGVDPLYRWMLTPRPHLGFTANPEGKTSKGYFGLTWTALLARNLLRPDDGIRLDIVFGGSINDGKHDTRLQDRKDLGGNLLFRIGGEIGYQVDRNWSVSLFVDHDSNASTARRNQGLNSVGVRIGYAL